MAAASCLLEVSWLCPDDRRANCSWSIARVDGMELLKTSILLEGKERR